MFSNIYLMTEISHTLQKAEEFFLQYIDQIEQNKVSDISIRRALKKYDVKNLKINNVTPLRAKKMYAAIIPKYSYCLTTAKSWLQNQRRLFIWCTLCYLHKNSLDISDLKLKDFEFLRKMFPLKQLDLIKFQIYSLIKKDNKNSSWKMEQDMLLRELVNKQDIKQIQWSNVSKQFFIKSNQQYFRNAKQCRERWLNHLDPNKTKGTWSPEQDIILLGEVKSKGKKWSKIVEALDGKKNEHMIKNRYKSLIHKKQKSSKTKNLKQKEIIQILLKEYEEENKIGKKQSQEQEMEQQEQESKIQKIQEEEEEDSEEQEEQKQEQENVNIVYKKEEKKESKPNNFLLSCRNWPIIIEHKPEKVQENERQNVIINEVQICGNKADKDIFNNLFINVSTPVADQSRIQSIILEGRSPAPQNLFLSPFPAACWTPTNFFLVDDGQNLGSPQNSNNEFSTKMRSVYYNFIQDK